MDRRALIGIGVGAVLLAGGFAAVIANRGSQPDDGLAQLGRGIGDVLLVNDDGETQRWGDIGNRPRAVFFGFTNCPVICPVTVWELNDALDRIGAAATDVDIVFVTIDPERDTAERLKSYFSGFDGRVHGYTGSPEAIDRVARAFEVFYQRGEVDGDNYSMDHTSTVFLLDGSGRVRDVVAYGSPPEVVEARLRELIGAPPV